MSRIGNVPVEFPDEVDVEVDGTNRLTVDGPKGTLHLDIDPDMKVEIGDGEVVVRRPSDTKRHRSMHGLYRSLIENLVTGVVEGYKKELKLIGIGYQARVQGDILRLDLGFSHPIFFVAPDEVDVSVDTQRGNEPIIVIEGADKQLVGEVAAKIRQLRPPEPYKGKGIRYIDEHISLKPGKAAVR